MKFLIVALLSTCTLVHASVRVPALFSDHAVLQQGDSTAVWGWAEPDERVQISYGAQSVEATAGTGGRWSASLRNLTTGTTGDLIIKGASGSLTIKDVLVGEVWLGSGQSNMAMTVSRAKDFDAEKAAATESSIRVFTERSGASSTAQSECRGTWEVCSPASVGSFSATLYFFGREIQRALKVPVGLINSSVGGTPIESWIDEATQRARPELAGFFTRKDPFDPETAKAVYQKQLAKWQEDVKKARAERKTLPRKPRDPMEVQGRKGNVGGLFNGKISPLVGYSIRGVLWYQGEANAQPEKSPYYGAQLSLLIEDWRKRWGQVFPVAWVQLPNLLGRGDSWCQVREGMFQTLRLKDTGMAVTIDIGDPGNIHPQNKQEVGRRLSLWALGSVYGKGGAVSGPRLTGSVVKGADVALSFSHADGGLVLKDGSKDFTLAGADKVWHPAIARVEGGQIIVTSPEVPQPVAARYAWAEVPAVTLWNGAGLPASPFRTDDWPLIAAENPRAKGASRARK